MRNPPSKEGVIRVPATLSFSWAPGEKTIKMVTSFHIQRRTTPLFTFVGTDRRSWRRLWGIWFFIRFPVHGPRKGQSSIEKLLVLFLFHLIFLLPLFFVSGRKMHANSLLGVFKVRKGLHLLVDMVSRRHSLTTRYILECLILEWSKTMTNTLPDKLSATTGIWTFENLGSRRQSWRR